jgi:hypothetical protein
MIHDTILTLFDNTLNFLRNKKYFINELKLIELIKNYVMFFIFINIKIIKVISIDTYALICVIIF